METRAMAIALFYACGTGVAIAAPWTFGKLIETGSYGERDDRVRDRRRDHGDRRHRRDPARRRGGGEVARGGRAADQRGARQRRRASPRHAPADSGYLRRAGASLRRPVRIQAAAKSATSIAASGTRPPARRSACTTAPPSPRSGAGAMGRSAYRPGFEACRSRNARVRRQASSEASANSSCLRSKKLCGAPS